MRRGLNGAQLEEAEVMEAGYRYQTLARAREIVRALLGEGKMTGRCWEELDAALLKAELIVEATDGHPWPSAAECGETHERYCAAQGLGNL